MSRRDAANLAKLMQAKREADAAAARAAEKAPLYEQLERAAKYAKEGDHSRATRAFYEAVHGPEKAKELFPQVYDHLTSEVLGVEAGSKIQGRVERDLARLQREHEELAATIARDQAAHQQWAAANREERISGAVGTISQMLEASKDYPYLAAESDDAAQVVWEIMVEAAERGEEPPSPEEAAKLANDHFQSIFEKKRTRYQQLLAQQSASGTAQQEAANSQTAPRMSLTNVDATQAPDLKTAPKFIDREQSIDAAWRLLQERSRQSP
jgi:hypothetical protein